MAADFQMLRAFEMRVSPISSLSVQMLRNFVEGLSDQDTVRISTSGDTLTLRVELAPGSGLPTVVA